MKRFSVFLILSFLIFGSVMPSQAFAAVKKTAVKAPVVKVADLPGRLVLQKDSENKLWYVNPTTKVRYYIRNDADFKWLIGKFGVKPTVKEFNGLAKNKNTKTSIALTKKYSGKIIISPTSSTTIYFFNPIDKIAYRVNNFSALYGTAKAIGLSVSDVLLRGIAMNKDQFTYDPTYYGTAQVEYDGTSYAHGKESGRILPLASLSKVMTALVFFDTNPDWEKIVTITPEEIQYPCTLQACGSTSEVPLKSGDRVKIKDLWVAMLTASSNQSAKILANNSGLTTEEFVAKMNQKAKDLGLKKTQFVEMSGLSADNISTAEEFAKIVYLAFTNDIIAQGTRHTDYTFQAEQSDGAIRYVNVANRNYSLLAFGVDASKSGYLVEAQRNAVIMKNNKVIVVFHAYSLSQRNSMVKAILDSDQLARAQ